ncbi:TPA: hypothetical protein HA265_01265 [Candidatus Woesearchaeota archaeon]|nr:hypothetical protein [Candidatus Woesearchaeota archaeon]
MRILISKILVLALITIIAVGTIGCSVPGSPEPKPKRDVLNVYVDGGTGDNVGAILIAKIRIDNGKINLTQESVHPESERLLEAIEELQARPSLELMYEDMEDGKLMMYVINITAEHPNYLHALSDALRSHSSYRIKSVVGKETINT